SPAGRRVKLMLPLRPDSALLWSPDHSPASEETSVAVPTTGTAERDAPQAVRANDRTATSKLVERNMGTSGEKGCELRVTAARAAEAKNDAQRVNCHYGDCEAFLRRGPETRSVRRGNGALVSLGT